MHQSLKIPAISAALGLLLAACGTPTAAPSPNATPPSAVGAKAASPGSSSASNNAADGEWQTIVEAGKREGKVLIYGFLLTGPEGAAIAQEFKKQTGIQVDFVAGAGSPMYQRIRDEARGGAPAADLFEGSQPWPSIIQKDGVFVPLKEKPLPVLRERESVWYVPPSVASPTGDYLASRFPSNPGHILVNSQLLKPEEYPKSFGEVANNPKYKGKLVWVNPKTTGDVAYKWTLWGYVAKSMTLEDVWRIYSNQAPLQLPAPMDGAGAIARGEAAIAFSTSSIEGLFQAGAPMKLLFFPGVPFVEGIAGVGLVKDAPNPNAALVFVNWALSKEGQEVITKTAGIRSVRRDVPDGTPEGLKAEVVGGGSRGPTYLLTGPQATLAGDMHTAKVFQALPEGISQADFETGVNNYIKEWEAKAGGPQNLPVQLSQ